MLHCEYVYAQRESESGQKLLISETTTKLIVVTGVGEDHESGEEAEGQTQKERG
jgi:hypothetical protein